MTPDHVDPVDQLARALDKTARLIAGVRPDQWGSPTPNPGWNIRSLVRHVITGNFGFASALQGTPPASPGAESLNTGPELVTAYRASADTVLAAFREPGALHETVTVPFGTVPGMVALHLRITEILVHGWDVARASGQPALFPRDLAEQEIEFSRRALDDIPADRRPFAPEQPVAGDAPAIDRLAALLGRKITARAPLGA